MRTYLLLPLLLVSISLSYFPSTNEANMQAKQLEEFLQYSSTFPSSNVGSLHFALSNSLYIEDQDGLMEKDKISLLPGQPNNVDFAQYSGYVNLDSNHEEALFYYLVESPQNSSSKPLLLWLNGGPGCSSLGYGAMMELGPFRVKSDRKTLEKNPYSWNNVANVLFVESPAGVGYSYTKREESGDIATAEGNYVFLVNWLERFPQYKGRDFFIAGESYSGHYIPQLASLILHHNTIRNDTKINLLGIIIGNAYVDMPINRETTYEYMWSHALISNSIYGEIKKNCNFSSSYNAECASAISKAQIGNINRYNIYAPICAGDHDTNKSNSRINSDFDPCSESYVHAYLNNLAVKEAFHALSGAKWKHCRIITWRDSAPSMHDVLKQLTSNGLTLWLYSGDVDAIVSVTSTRRSVEQLGLPITKEWHPWYFGVEVGGYAAQHKGFAFVTVRGAGHLVPSNQPERALALISSFLHGKLPPDTPSS